MFTIRRVQINYRKLKIIEKDEENIESQHIFVYTTSNLALNDFFVILPSTHVSQIKNDLIFISSNIKNYRVLDPTKLILSSLKCKYMIIQLRRIIFSSKNSVEE